MYTPIELMICCAARELEDGKRIKVGPAKAETPKENP